MEGKLNLTSGVYMEKYKNRSKISYVLERQSSVEASPGKSHSFWNIITPEIWHP